jgi:hypothetical protein
MPDSPPYPDAGDATGLAQDRGAPSGMPRWVKVSAVVAAVLVALVVVMLLVGGDHGPGRHL